MSHAPSTGAKYYQAVTGRKEAAKAYLLRRKLVGKSKEENESEASEVENVESEDKSEASEVGSEEAEQHKVECEKTRPVKEQMPKKRQPFTDKERKLIRSYFQQNIKTKTTPSIGKCRQFLAQNSVGHTAKQIQDHVRQCY